MSFGYVGNEEFEQGIGGQKDWDRFYFKET